MSQLSLFRGPTPAGLAKVIAHAPKLQIAIHSGLGGSGITKLPSIDHRALIEALSANKPFGGRSLSKAEARALYMQKRLVDDAKRGASTVLAAIMGESVDITPPCPQTPDGIATATQRAAWEQLALAV